ncbi:MAG TPA: acylphosphatase [Tepidisphaeraceae bacterium]|jgi:acylphosphatase
MHRRICHFTGRVQGVGFRYTVQNIAQQYAVAGYVKNLPDGRVELVMEGPDSEMDHLMDQVKNKMDGFIRGVDLNEGDATGEFAHFSVKHG